MKFNIEPTEIHLDEVGFSVGLAIMAVGIFVSGWMIIGGIVVLVLSLFLPDFITLEIGKVEDDDLDR